jgi:hypothetical protein
MRIEALQSAWIHDLNDLRSADLLIAGVLPTLIESASDNELRSVLTDHLEATRSLLARLEASLGGFDLPASTPRRDDDVHRPQVPAGNSDPTAERYLGGGSPRSQDEIDDRSPIETRWTTADGSETTSDPIAGGIPDMASEDEPAPDRTTSRLRTPRRRFQRDALAADLS